MSDGKVVSFAEAVSKATKLTRELVESLALIRWAVLEPPMNKDDAVFYQGTGAGWFVTVASWKLREAEDDPERGYDGTFVKDGSVVRLTRDVAKQVFLCAEEALKP